MLLFHIVVIVFLEWLVIFTIAVSARIDTTTWKCTCLGQTTTASTITDEPQQPQDMIVGARILYLITVHNARTIDDAVYLFRAIRDVRNTILIHIDVKLDRQVFLESQLHYDIQHCSCGSNVMVESLFDVQWGTWSMNLPTLWAMQTGIQLLEEQQQQQHQRQPDNNNHNNTTSLSFLFDFDVFINLSGDTMAVLTPNTMAHLLQQPPLAHTNFCTSSACETGLRPTHIMEFPPFWHKRSHYDHGQPIVIDYYYDTTTIYSGGNATSDDTTVADESNGRAANNSTTTTTQQQQQQQQATLYIHFGSQWMTLTRDFCQWLIQSLQHPNSLASRFRDVLIERQYLMTDETYFSTLLVHVFPETLPQVVDDTSVLTTTVVDDDDDAPYYRMSAIRYERMDEHMPTAIRGYYPMNPRYQVPKASRDVVDEPKVWGPYYLGMYDLYDIRQSGALFCRKVSTLVDVNLIQMLPVDRHDQLPPIQWPLPGVSISELPNWEMEKARLIQLAKEEAEKEEKEQQEQEQLQEKERQQRSGPVDIPDQPQEVSTPPNRGHTDHQQHFTDRDDIIASYL